MRRQDNYAPFLRPVTIEGAFKSLDKFEELR
jgi:hypothetical protein